MKNLRDSFQFKNSNLFWDFYDAAKASEVGQAMLTTVEGTEWHREESVWRHTEMCLEHYLETTAADRSDLQIFLTLLCLLGHDFGKPEAEEVIEAKDGSGLTRKRYAGHESKSANEFLSFMCGQKELRDRLFKAGFSWIDVRKIKFMIEQHLPYGLKNQTKRENLKRAVIATLGDDEQCFYDQLWSDCCGRISDDHEIKKQSVLAWIDEFKAHRPSKSLVQKSSKTMYVLVGPVGFGKSTWATGLKSLNKNQKIVVISEDSYRLQFFANTASAQVIEAWSKKTTKECYAEAWQFCFDNSSDYDKFAKACLKAAVESGDTLVLDRTNQTRKSRSPWIQAARQAGYQISSIEFFGSEALSLSRQKTRRDKDVPAHRVHQIYMAFEVPWVGVEVDSFDIVDCA